MSKLMLTTTALLGLNAGAAYAYMDADAIVAYFADAKPTKIEIQRGTGLTKVEVTTPTGKIEVIFDDGDENLVLYREDKDSEGNTIFKFGNSALEDAFDDHSDDEDDDEEDDDDDEDDDHDDHDDDDDDHEDHEDDDDEEDDD